MRTLIPLIILLLAALSSCTRMILNAVLRDPVVETTASTRAFQEENGFSTTHSYILQSDSANALMSLVTGMEQSFMVFNASGEPCCYQGAATCEGVQVLELFEKPELFPTCSSGTHLKEVLARLNDLNDQPVTMEQLPAASFYIVTHWQKFLGGKKGYRDNVVGMEEEIRKRDLASKIVFLKVNADLQERWGFKAGEKARLRWKKNGRELEMVITDLPFK